MKTVIGQTTLELVEGDITTQTTDAIVNAANSALAGGGGVDGAIHAAGGPAIMEECRALGGCPTGQAVITGAGLLPARYVIHAVGPIYNASDDSAPGLLASSYRESLALAVRQGLRSIAFPSISTGVYGYPMRAAATVALTTTMEFLRQEHHALEVVRFVLFGKRAEQVYFEVLQELLAGAGAPGA